MMRRDDERSSRGISLADTARLLVGLALISAATATPSLAIAKSVAAQPVHVQPAMVSISRLPGESLQPMAFCLRTSRPVGCCTSMMQGSVCPPPVLRKLCRR